MIFHKIHRQPAVDLFGCKMCMPFAGFSQIAKQGRGALKHLIAALFLCLGFDRQGIAIELGYISQGKKHPDQARDQHRRNAKADPKCNPKSSGHKLRG